MMEQNDSNKYYIYVYLDPYKPGLYIYGQYSFDFEPFYVGKGSGRRYKTHLWKSMCINNFVSHKINKIKSNGGTPVIILHKNNLTETESYELEADMVKIIGRRNINTGPLTNLTDGGTGGVHIVYTEEQRRRRSKQVSGKNNGMYGKHHPAGTLHLMSISRTGEKNANAKPYKITDTNGNIIIIKSLKTFCKEHNLVYNTIRSAMHTKRWHSGYFIEPL